MVLDSTHPDSKEYKLGTSIASQMRNNVNQALGDILNLIEAALTDKQQCEATKKLTKQFLWKMADDNQHVVYRELGVENWPPIGSSQLTALEQ